MPPVTVKAMAERRVRRQKQFIAVGTLVLLAVVGFEMTKFLGGKGGGEAQAVTTTAAASAPASPLAAAPETLPDTDRVVVERDSDQLLSFGLFKSKDPFVQQLATTTTTPAAPPPPPTPTPKAAKRPAGAQQGLTPAITTTTGETTTSSSSTTTPTTTGTTTSPAPTTTTAPGPPPLPPNAVLLSTNGVCEQVSVKGTFPANEDIFRLVSIAKDRRSVEIGVVGGSYDSGQATATVKLGEKLTLVNTADGTRYVIVFERKCDVVRQPETTSTQAATTTAATTTTSPLVPPPVPPPTTTATEPIVTDPYDTTTPSS